MTSRCIFDLASKKRAIAELEQESLAPDFYQDRAHAQRQMRELGRLRDEVAAWEGLETQLTDPSELAGVLDGEPDEQLQAEMSQAADAADAELEKRRLTLLLSGEHDTKAAIVSIH